MASQFTVETSKMWRLEVAAVKRLVSVPQKKKLFMGGGCRITFYKKLGSTMHSLHDVFRPLKSCSSSSLCLLFTSIHPLPHTHSFLILYSIYCTRPTLGAGDIAMNCELHFLSEYLISTANFWSKRKGKPFQC